MTSYYDQWKEAVYKAAEAAEKRYKSRPAFARAVGLSRNQINAFLDNKHLSGAALEKLSSELEALGYLHPDARAQELPEPYGIPHDPAWLAGQSMIATGLWLQSPDLSVGEKMAAYRDWLKNATLHLEKMAAEAKERGK